MIPVIKPFMLPLTGARGSRKAAETNAELPAVVRAHDDVVMDCDGVTDADQIFLQLIAACHCGAAAQGRRFSVRPRLAGALPGALARCGFASALCEGMGRRRGYPG